MQPRVELADWIKIDENHVEVQLTHAGELDLHSMLTSNSCPINIVVLNRIGAAFESACDYVKSNELLETYVSEHGGKSLSSSESPEMVDSEGSRSDPLAELQELGREVQQELFEYMKKIVRENESPVVAVQEEGSKIIHYICAAISFALASLSVLIAFILQLHRARYSNRSEWQPPGNQQFVLVLPSGQQMMIQA